MKQHARLQEIQETLSYLLPKRVPHERYVAIDSPSASCLPSPLPICIFDGVLFVVLDVVQREGVCLSTCAILLPSRTTGSATAIC